MRANRWQLRCFPPQWIYCPWSLVPSHPSLPLEIPGSSCSAGLPLPREGLFLWPWTGSLGFGSCWDCVFRKQRLLAPPVIFPLGRESRQRRGRGSGGRDSPSGAVLLGTPSPGSGGPQRFQLLRVPPGPTWGSRALGMLLLPCPAPGPAGCWKRRLPALGAVLGLLLVIPLPAQPSQGPSFPPRGVEHP